MDTWCGEVINRLQAVHACCIARPVPNSPGAAFGHIAGRAELFSRRMGLRAGARVPRLPTSDSENPDAPEKGSQPDQALQCRSYVLK